MPRSRVPGDLLVPGEVIVEADSPEEAAVKSTDSEHWLDHQLYDTHHPHCLGFQPTEATKRLIAESIWRRLTDGILKIED